MLEVFKPVAVERHGNALVITRQREVTQSPRLRAKFALLVALATGTADIRHSDNDVITAWLPEGAMALEAASLITLDTVDRLWRDMRNAGSIRPGIAKSKCLAFGVEVAFQERLGCVPDDFHDALTEIHGATAVVSKQPAYGLCVLEIYIPGLNELPWGDIKRDLRSLFNFDA